MRIAVRSLPCISIQLLFLLHLLTTQAHAAAATSDGTAPISTTAGKSSASEWIIPVQARRLAEVKVSSLQRGSLAVQLRKRVGSRPPMCRHKCNACFPCEAVQVPAPISSSPITTDFLHLDYSNYQPEGWKCKCGTRIFNP